MGDTVSSRQSNAARLAVIENDQRRLIKLLEEGSGTVPGMAKRLADTEYKFQSILERLDTLQQDGKKVNKDLLEQIAKTNDRIDCHLKEDQERLKKVQEKWGARIEKLVFEGLSILNTILTVFLLTKLGLK